MDFEYLQIILSLKLDDLSGADSRCHVRIGMSLVEYKSTAKILEACGYDTADLILAIREVQKAAADMMVERMKAVNKFKTEGFRHLIYDVKQKRLKGEESLLPPP